MFKLTGFWGKILPLKILPGKLVDILHVRINQQVRNLLTLPIPVYQHQSDFATLPSKIALSNNNATISL